MMLVVMAEMVCNQIKYPPSCLKVVNRSPGKWSPLERLGRLVEVYCKKGQALAMTREVFLGPLLQFG